MSSLGFIDFSLAKATTASAIGWTAFRSNPQAIARASSVSHMGFFSEMDSIETQESFPVVKVPVLSNAILLQFAKASRTTPPFRRIPLRAQLLIALKYAVGVA